MLGTNQLVSSSRVDARRQVTDGSVSRGRVEEGVAKTNKSPSKVTLEQDGRRCCQDKQESEQSDSRARWRDGCEGEMHGRRERKASDHSIY